MKRFLFAGVAAFALTFISCQTDMALTNPEQPIEIAGSFGVPNLEFIGFKGSGNFGQLADKDVEMITKTKALRRLGGELQASGIAVDQSLSYFGIYSLQELETYKNKKRFVTFVDISDFQLTHELMNGGQNMAALTLVCTGFLAPIGIFLFRPWKTEMHLKASCNIFIYDCDAKTVVGTRNVVVNRADIYKGSWGDSSETAKLEIYENYGTILANEIYREYSSVSGSFEQ